MGPAEVLVEGQVEGKVLVLGACPIQVWAGDPWGQLEVVPLLVVVGLSSSQLEGDPEFLGGILVGTAPVGEDQTPVAYLA